MKAKIKARILLTSLGLGILLCLGACGGDKDDGSSSSSSSSSSSGHIPITWQTADHQPPEQRLGAAIDGAQSVATADINKDGLVDVIAAGAGGTIAWFENTGASGFTQHTVTTNQMGAANLLVLDFDDDGDIDIIATGSQKSKNLVWYKNNGAAIPQFTEQLVDGYLDGEIVSVQALDIDSDGDLDLVGARQTHDNMVVWYDKPEPGSSVEGYFGRRPIKTGRDRANAVYLIDFDQDGDNDIVASLSNFESNTHNVVWFENDGIEVEQTIDGLTYSPAPSFIERPITTLLTVGKNLKVLDFDNDSDLDLLTSSDFKLYWHENLGGNKGYETHTINAGSLFQIGNLSVMDLDGDNDLDLITSDKNRVLWFENTSLENNRSEHNGSPKPEFIQHTLSTNTYGASGISAADLNGDNIPEIISAQEARDDVFWQKIWQRHYTLYEGESLEIMEAANGNNLTYQLFSEPASANVFEFNGSNLNIASAPAFDINGLNQYQATLTVSDGVTTLRRRMALSVLADDNDDDDDGVPDIADAFPRNAKEFADSDGDGIGNNADSDDDGDGIADMMDNAALDPTRFAAPVWLNQAQPEHYKILDGLNLGNLFPLFNSLSLGDVDGDNDPDILIGSDWLENDGALPPNYLQREIDISRNAMSEFVDFDGDGDLDILSYTEAHIIWNENNSSSEPLLNDPVILLESDADRTFSKVETVDINRDGKMDILATLYKSGSADSQGNVLAYSMEDLVLFIQSSSPTLAFTRHDVHLGPIFNGSNTIQIRDMDGDADLDIFFFDYNKHNIMWFENDGSNNPDLSEKHVLTPYGNSDRAENLELSDLDGDDDLDLLSTSKLYGYIVWYENNKTQNPMANRHVVGDTSLRIRRAATGDINLDGNMDIVAVSSTNNEVISFTNNGAAKPSFNQQIIIKPESIYYAGGSNSYPPTFHLKDLDSDGDPDIIWIADLDKNYDTYSLNWYENSGGDTPTFTRHILGEYFEYPLNIYFRDMLGDGSLDVALLYTASQGIQLAWNAPDTVHLTVTAGQNASFDQSATDADGDTIHFAITHGPDAHLGDVFSIDEKTGMLSVTNAPPTDNPSDSNGNNQYVFWISASDGVSSIYRRIVVTVVSD